MSQNPFGTLNNTDLEESRDVLGGGNQPLETDAYTGKIKLAYAGKSAQGANFLAVHIDANGREYRETIYVTNRKGENFYPRDDKKIPLPGFTVANDLALLSTGQDLASQTFEEKVVSLYDFDERKEVPTKVLAATSMMGKDITVGILKTITNKSKKNESTGAYEPINEKREENNIDKVFHAETKKTVSEFTTRAENAEFYPKWVEKNRGQTRNKYKEQGSSGLPGQAAPAPGGASAPAGKSLFGG